MGNSNISKEMNSRKEKQESFFTKIHNLISGDQYIAISPGYSPPYKHIKEPTDIFKNNITLSLYLLEGIKTESKILLDIACGKGLSAYSYQNYLNLGTFYGIDLIEKAIDYCKNNYNGIFNVMDLNNIKYSEHSFDIVTSIDSLCGIVTDNKKFINTVYKILKPGGVFSHFDLEMTDDYVKEFKKTFNNVNIIDVTNNVKESCENFIKNVDSLQLTEKQKNIFLAGYKTNYNDIVNGSRYFKYMGYK